jgi:hypothetical protein
LLTLLAPEAGHLVELILLYFEIGLEVHADKTKHKYQYRNQNAGRSHVIKNDIFLMMMMMMIIIIIIII